jgi:ATP-dependent DNA helicase RecG
VQGILAYKEMLGEKAAKRLVAYLRDETGILELTWFKGLTWMQKVLKEGERYTVFGRVSFFMSNAQMVHPEIELVQPEIAAEINRLEPVYSTTEKLKARGLGGRQIGKLVKALLPLLSEKDLPENLPQPILSGRNFIPRLESYFQLHFPKTQQHYESALHRLKFEELFITQIRLALLKSERHRYSRCTEKSAEGNKNRHGIRPPDEPVAARGCRQRENHCGPADYAAGC